MQASNTALASNQLSGVGLGLKRELIAPIQAHHQQPLLESLNFVEIAPENWLNTGEQHAKQLEWFRARYPIYCHGLCLSLGGLDPLNVDFLKQVKAFIKQYDIPLYTEHLSYASDGHLGQHGYLYDLLPIPFTEEAVKHVAKRIQQTQDILEQKIAVENTSYYLNAPINTMDEVTFLNAVLTEADCLLHLDINNIYVNSVNFGFDPLDYLRRVDGKRIVYSHVAGHYQEAENLLIDTHGEDVIDPVWDLLAHAYDLFGIFPTLLERDSNIPPLETLMQEVDHIAKIQSAYQPSKVQQG